MGCAAVAGAVNNIVTIAPARMPCAPMPIITSVINYDDNYRPYPGFLGFWVSGYRIDTNSVSPGKVIRIYPLRNTQAD